MGLGVSKTGAQTTLQEGKSLGSVEPRSPPRGCCLPALPQDRLPLLGIFVGLEPRLPLPGLAAGVGSQHRAAGSHTDSYTGFASLSLYAETSYGCPRPKRALKTAAPGEALGGVRSGRVCTAPASRMPPTSQHCQRAHLFLHFPAGSTKASCSNKMYIVTHLLRNGSKGSRGRDSFRQLGPSRVWLPAGGGRAGAETRARTQALDSPTRVSKKQ